MEPKDTQKYVPFRGTPVAAAASGHVLVFVTNHPEGQPLALYRLDLDAATLSSEPLSAGAAAAVADGTSIYVAGTDGQIARAPIESGPPKPFGEKFDKAPAALAMMGEDRLAVGVGEAVVVLAAKTGKVMQRLDLGEAVSALAADDAGAWLVAGTAQGTVFALDGEDGRELVISDQKKLHQSGVTCLQFDPDEPRVYSGSQDQRLLLTHVRGELEPEDRGAGAAHDGALLAMAVREDKLYTSGNDGNLRTWLRGPHRRRPSTLRDVGQALAIVPIEHKGRPHLALVCEDATIRVHPLDAGGKVGESTLVIHDAYARAKHELEPREVARREAALQDLAGYNDKASIELIATQAESDPDHGLKVKATELLGQSENPRAVAPLEKLLGVLEEKVRLAALRGLRLLEGESSLRPLELALKGKKRDIGVEAVQALEPLAKSDDQALARLVKALDDDPLEVRSAALTSLEALHKADSAEASKIALRSKRADIRRLAIVRLYQRKLLDQAAVQVLLRRHLDDDDGSVRQAAFLVSVTSSKALTDALRARSAELHRLLWELETLGQKVDADAGPPKVKKAKASLSNEDVRPLLEAMASRSLDTCLAGARGLASLQDARAFGTLLQLTNEKEPSARVEACKALAELADPRGVPRLRQMLRDKAREVRDAAFTALTRLEESDALRAAQAGLAALHDDVRSRALQLLVRQMKKQAKAKGGGEQAEHAEELLQKGLNDAASAVRKEAFKAVLGLDVRGGGAATLRFALTSIHGEVRREVLGEVMGRIQETWAWALLLELLGDPDPTIRSEAFAFAQKRTKGKSKEPLAAALGGRYEDSKLEAIAALTKQRVEGMKALLASALNDEHEKVRLAAVEALVVEQAHDVLREAMSSEHEDVRVRAAAARAAHGDEKAREPLMALATAEEPDLAEKKAEWCDRVVRALGGLAELGDASARGAVNKLIAHDDARIRRAAAAALGWIATAGEQADMQALSDALSHADADVKLEAATGLALLGETAGLPLLEGLAKEKGERAVRGLLAALALGDKAGDAFMSYLDHPEVEVRTRALLLMMLVESSEQDGIPDRCLAGVSSKHPRTRLASARALESFAEAAAFEAWVTELFNDRGDDRAAWTVPTETVRAIAELVTHGEPKIRVRAARLLDGLGEEKQKRFDREYKSFSGRFKKPIETAIAAAKKRKPAKPGYAPEEMRRIVLGAYAGLSRQAGGGLETRVRQTALARLSEMATAEAELLPTIRPLLSMALADRDINVRKVAFESLLGLGGDSAALAAEAISVGTRDMGVAGLRLLSESGKAKDGSAVLEQVYLTNTDGLEQEAAKLLAETRGWPVVHEVGLQAKSVAVRDEAVRGLSRVYDTEASAKKALGKALKSPYQHVREAAALELARNKDAAAFDPVVDLLQTRRQKEAIEALERLGDKRTPAALMDRIDEDPGGTANIRALFQAIGRFRDPKTVDRLLNYTERKDTRQPSLEAVRVISGYDQRILDGDDQDPTIDPEERRFDHAPPVDWEKKQHPRHDAVLARLLDTAYRLGETKLIGSLLPCAQWSRGSDIDPVLATLSSATTDAVRDRAIAALGFRAKNRKASPDALVSALSHANPQTQLVAAEALARIGKNEGVRVLLTAVDMMPELEDRQRAVRALGALADAAAIDVLLRLVNEEGHALQEDAAEAIGHLSKVDKAETIEKLLLRLGKGEGGVAMRALGGLRWFNSQKGWDLIRERAIDEQPYARHQAVSLLAHNADPASRDAVVKCVEEDPNHEVARKAAVSLRILDGPDSLEPDLVFVRSPHAGLEKNTLQRLRERGAADKILEVLPRIPREHRDTIFEPLVSALLQRDPLPLEPAAKMLESPHEEVGTVAASIVGRAGPSASKKHGKALLAGAEKAVKVWEEKLDDVMQDRIVAQELQPFTTRYARMVWACGRVEVGEGLVVKAAGPKGDTPYARSIRVEALHVLARGFGRGKDAVEVLRTCTTDPDGRIRSLAAAAIAKIAPEAVNELVKSAMDDRSMLSRLVPTQKDVSEDARKALRKGVGSAHTQGVALPHLVAAADVSGLTSVLKDRDLSEATRLGAIEALARIASPDAQAAILEVAKVEKEDEDLRKAAWRALRRARRTAAAQARTEVTS